MHTLQLHEVTPQKSASALPAVDVLGSGDLRCLDLGNKHTQSITNSLLEMSSLQGSSANLREVHLSPADTAERHSLAINM